MNVGELIKKLNLEVISDGDNEQCEVEGCYASDLLSLAMSSVQSKNVWITVQTNINILGIASLTDAACTIVAQGMNIPQNVIDKAIEEKICLLRSALPVYELCMEIGKII